MRTHSNPGSLAGRWKFKTDPEGRGDFQEPDSSIESWQRQVTYFDLEYDDAAWDEIAVPACWQTAGYRYNGIAWYRTRFDHAPDGGSNVIRLLFKGVDYFADAWLNGYYLGSHEGFFHRFSFDASRWIRPGENLLTVKVDAPNLKRVLVKGALQGINWDCNDPTLDPGGIWNDVQLLASRDLYLEDLKVTPYIDLAGNSARILCRVTICNPTGEIKEISVGTTLSPHNFAGESHAAETATILPPGVSHVDLWLNLEDPRLWWPWDMGAQNLYDVAVSVTDEAGELDRLGDRIGLRHLRKEEGGWASYLNGKRIFCRGPNYVSEQLQSTMTRARYEFDVQLMKDANMNMVRSYCVVEREEFYDVCDEKGVMVYQDFPTTGRMSNRGDYLRRAVQQGRRMVNQLYHHPAIVLWSWGSQPAIKNFEKLCLALANACAEEDPHRFIQQGASVFQWRTAKAKFDWPIDFHLLPGWFHPDDRFGPFLMMERDECCSGYSVEELKIKRKELLGVRQRVRPAGSAAGAAVTGDRSSRRRTAGRSTGRRTPATACTATSCAAGSASRPAWSSSSATARSTRRSTSSTTPSSTAATSSAPATAPCSSSSRTAGPRSPPRWSTTTGVRSAPTTPSGRRSTRSTC